MASIRVTLLGTGTSSGVPVIGCDCRVCRSDDPRDRRTRTGAKVETAAGTLLIDTPPELRLQALRHGLDRVDGVLFTHSHADHIFGLDDLRIFNFRQGGPIACYGSRTTLAGLRRSFWYVFEHGQEGGGRPILDLIEVDGPFEAVGETVIPVPIQHGELPIHGFRIGGFAYLTDCNGIPPASARLLEGLDVLVLGALRYHPHPTHFTVAEAVAAAQSIGARRTFLTHLAHEVEHARPEVPLPAGLGFAHDGLVLDIG